MDTQKFVISKHKKQRKNHIGNRVDMQQVVFKIPDGKNKKGKPKLKSVTRHIPV